MFSSVIFFSFLIVLHQELLFLIYSTLLLIILFSQTGPHQSPPLMEPSTAASHDSFLPPSPAPGPGEAGGAVPGSSEPGGSTNSAGSFSRAPLVQQLYPMIMILSLSFYLHM
jgi:hypothetical protein